LFFPNNTNPPKKKKTKKNPRFLKLGCQFPACSHTEEGFYFEDLEEARAKSVIPTPQTPFSAFSPSSSELFQLNDIADLDPDDFD